jgi:hypothetical protein
MKYPCKQKWLHQMGMFRSRANNDAKKGMDIHERLCAMASMSE